LRKRHKRTKPDAAKTKTTPNKSNLKFILKKYLQKIKAGKMQYDKK